MKYIENQSDFFQYFAAIQACKLFPTLILIDDFFMYAQKQESVRSALSLEDVLECIAYVNDALHSIDSLTANEKCMKLCIVCDNLNDNTIISVLLRYISTYMYIEHDGAVYKLKKVCGGQSSRVADKIEMRDEKLVIDLQKSTQHAESTLLNGS